MTTPRALTPPLSVAPMMDHTDRHFRAFLRRLTRHALLYTEMITTQAILRGDREHHLGFSREEKPLALQLGGDDPGQLAECARIAEEMGYDEVNLNVGCPSDRVQSGRFGACLMAEPERVADAVAAMRGAVRLPVTVKHRIGVDQQDRYEDLCHFVTVVAAAGCDRFTVHARKAWLHGLSPKENRTVPPLRYPEVYRLKRELPQLQIEVNGGIRSLAAVRAHLAAVDGAMIGRAAYEDPYLLASADAELFGSPLAPPSRGEVVAAMVPYLAAQLARDVPLMRIGRHLLGLFAGQPGARSWKRHLSERGRQPGAGVAVVLDALAAVPPEVRDARPSVVGPAAPLPAELLRRAS